MQRIRMEVTPSGHIWMHTPSGRVKYPPVWKSRCSVKKDRSCSDSDDVKFIGYELIGDGYLELYQCTLCHNIISEAEYLK